LTKKNTAQLLFEELMGIKPSPSVDPNILEDVVPISVEDEDDQQPVYADPLEVFSSHGMEWRVYEAEPGVVYYLVLATGHSQWEDPRDYGIVKVGSTSEVAEEGSQSNFSDQLNHANHGSFSGSGPPSGRPLDGSHVQSDGSARNLNHHKGVIGSSVDMRSIVGSKKSAK
jgi:hypothetical protein